MKRLILILCLVSNLGFVSVAQQSSTFPTLAGPYLGQKQPGIIPEIFAPGIICTGMMERDITISKDGKEIYYGFSTGRLTTIMFTRLSKDGWTEPEIAPFALDQKFSYLEPCLSSDGKRIFFLTNHPSTGKEPKPRWAYQNIWVADRLPDGSWGKPYDPDSTINGNKLQYYPSLTNDGTMYFTRHDAQTKRNAICRSRFINGKFTEAEELPAKINQEGTTPYNAFISPDESFLIVCIDGRKNDANPGAANYYVFFRNNDDSWSDGVLLGPEINMKGSNAVSASISPDGKYLFFAAQKVAPRFEDADKITTLSKILESINSPQNGNYDIYWVDSKIIEDLSPKKIQTD